MNTLVKRSVVPDLYYDLIARVVPGTIFLVEAVLVCEPLRSVVFSLDLSKIGTGHVTAGLMFILVIGYVVALLASPFGEKLRRLSTKIVWKNAVDGVDLKTVEVLKTRLGIEYSKSQTAKELDRNYRILHDFVRAVDKPQRTLTLSKMQAEAALCAGIAGLSGMLLVGMVIARFCWGVTRIHVADVLWTLVVTALAMLATYERNLRLIERHLVFFRRWLIVISTTTVEDKTEKAAGGLQKSAGLN